MANVHRFLDGPRLVGGGMLGMCPPKRTGNALVVAGGGAHGAKATGTLKALNKRYDAAAGISTGNLIAPIALGGEYDRLIEAYTNVSLDDIFSVCPFTDKGKLRVLHALKRLALRKGSLGEMHRLKPLIKEFYPEELYHRTLAQKKVALCGALNLCHEPFELELFRTDAQSYETFIQAMYASCCFWPVAEVATIGSKQYVNGGYVETLLIAELMAMGYTNINVITLRPKHEVKTSHLATRRPWETFKRIATAIRYDTVYENLNKAKAYAAQRDDVTINVYYTPHKLSDNAMHFDRSKMRDWVKLGEDIAFDPRYVESF